MTMVFDGRAFAKRKKQELYRQVEQLKKKPAMVSVLVGEDSERELYTKMKKRVAEEIGVKFEVSRVSGEVEIDKLKEIVSELGTSDIDGLMVQLPLPKQLKASTEKVLGCIPLAKDVDGLRWRESEVMPATVRAVISVLDELEKDLEDVWQGKFVVVGYTGSVGMPMAEFLRQRDVEVVGINTKTEDPQMVLESADVIVSCAGAPGVVPVGNYKDNLIVVDVGIEMVDGKAVGDVVSEVYQVARAAVPVPGGIGPVTVVSLIENLVKIGRE